MIHRESGFYKTNYAADMSLYPLPIGRYAIIGAAILFAVQRYTSLHFFLYAGVGVVSCFVIGLIASHRRIA